MLSRILIFALVLLTFAACSGSAAPQATAVPAATIAPPATAVSQAATAVVAPTASEVISPTVAPSSGEVISPTVAPSGGEVISPTVAPTLAPAPTSQVISPTEPVSITLGEVRVITGTGATADELKPTVDAYRQELGEPNNGGKPGTQPSGHREINWDGVPDELSAPNSFPADFFNADADPRARGALLSTPGTSLMVSAKANNPSGTLPLFGNINPQYPKIFKAFSPERVFSPSAATSSNWNFLCLGQKHLR